MNWNEILDDIIGGLKPETVPVEYIVMAKIVDHNGIDRVIKGTELANFMANPGKFQVREARVILDVRKIRKTMLADITTFFTKLSTSH